jgi:hypothetical protein
MVHALDIQDELSSLLATVFTKAYEMNTFITFLSQN